jgi:hypothetical protein
VVFTRVLHTIGLRISLRLGLRSTTVETNSCNKHWDTIFMRACRDKPGKHGNEISGQK